MRQTFRTDLLRMSVQMTIEIFHLFGLKLSTRFKIKLNNLMFKYNKDRVQSYVFSLGLGFFEPPQLSLSQTPIIVQTNVKFFFNVRIITL